MQFLHQILDVQQLNAYLYLPLTVSALPFFALGTVLKVGCKAASLHLTKLLEGPVIAMIKPCNNGYVAAATLH